MKQAVNFLISIFSVLLFANCQPQRNTEDLKDKFKLRVSASQTDLPSVILKKVNAIDFQDSIIIIQELDSLGELVIEESLHAPLLTYLVVDDINHPVYLKPGDNLTVHVNQSEIYFSGKGAELSNAVSQYLKQFLAIREQYVVSNGNMIFNLDYSHFVDRMDSLQNALGDFHQAFIDSVNLPQELSNSLENRNRINLVWLKENCELANPEMNNSLNIEKSEKKLDSVYFAFPFSDTLLKDQFTALDYTIAAQMYLDLHVLRPAYKNLPQVKNGYINDSIPSEEVIPYVTNQLIENMEISEEVKEFLLAKNTLSRIMDNGISESTDSLMNNFKRTYSNSIYTAALENEYRNWNAIIPGKPAPDFVGITPEGEKVSLSDLCGKVVYIDFWATWCGPCIEQFPYSEQLESEFEGSENVAFLYVSVDKNKEKWERMIKNKNLHGLHVIDAEVANHEKSVWNKYVLRGVPRFILVDQSGLIANENAPIPSSGKVKAEVDKLLAKGI
ncbi:TlpA family protein disulfide reductase [Chondrinema litorale]|uniref:TlpA family protein disulfide reductase n=1 Tax=Chondrinema litorale TaxID=2994555 RepID=UPI00254317BB|nr:TlpA disulfide reductase family protein [Chondrinema litorale]UZR97057.1 TlpA disulfide reductase family protein [Chondrinema litorale]